MPSEPEVRILDLFRPDGFPRGNLAAIVSTFLLFPEDARSREQALALFELENAAYHAGKADYQQSTLVKVISTWAMNKQGQRYAAGLTMLAFHYLFKQSSEAVTLYRAAKVVEAALLKAMESEERPLKAFIFDSGEVTVKGIKVPSGAREIQRAYKAYESVAHFLGADLLTTNTLEVLPLFERHFDMDSIFLNTAAELEQIMIHRGADYFVNPWRVAPILPDGVRALGPVAFDGEFVEFLGRGFEESH